MAGDERPTTVRYGPGERGTGRGLSSRWGGCVLMFSGHASNVSGLSL